MLLLYNQQNNAFLFVDISNIYREQKMKLNTQENIKLIKKLVLVFVLAFIFNLVWENWHAQFYVHYQGGEITEWILARSAIIDALFITTVGVFFFTVSYLKNRLWISIIFGVIVAILLETFAFESGRWAYNEMMPIIPFLNTGLTPTVQLGLLSYLIYKFVNIIYRM